MLLLYCHRMGNQQERKQPEKADLGAAVITSGKDRGREKTLNPPYFGSAGCPATGTEEWWSSRDPHTLGALCSPSLYPHTGMWELFPHLCKSQGAEVNKTEMKYGKLLSN